MRKIISYPGLSLFAASLVVVTCVFAGQADDNALLQAARNGDLGSLKKAIDKGADINAQEELRNETALIMASVEDRLEVVKELLDKGAKVDKADKFGGTALTYASSVGNFDIVKELLKYKADVNAKDMHGVTALMNAAANGYRPIVEILLASGAKVESEDHLGRTAWVYAMNNGRNEIIQLLKNAGAEERYGVLEWYGLYSVEKEPSESVITTERGWKWLWRHVLSEEEKYDPDSWAPIIDFDKHVVACVFLGTRPTGGYAIEFKQPYIKDNKMVIPYEEIKPGAGQFVTQALTQPFIVKAFKRMGSGEIVLEKVESEKAVTKKAGQ